MIGLILSATAAFLAYESKGLLIGEGADPIVVAGLEKIIEDEPGIRSVRPPLTMHFGPNEVFLALDVNFKPDLTALEVEQAVVLLETNIRQAFPDIKRIFIEARALSSDRNTSR